MKILLLFFVCVLSVVQASYLIDPIGGTGEYDPAAAVLPNPYYNGTSVFSDDETKSIFSVDLAQPVAIVKDDTDNSLVFVDYGHSAIRRVDVSGAVSTILSGFNINAAYPQFLTIDPETGSLYSTDGQNVFCIPKSSGSYGTPNILATQYTSSSSGTNRGALGWSVAPTYDERCWYETPKSDFVNPQGVAFDSSGHFLYVAGMNSGNVWQFVLNASDISKLSDANPPYKKVVIGLTNPQGIAFGNSNLYVTDFPYGEGSVVRQYSSFREDLIEAGSEDIFAGLASSQGYRGDGGVATSATLSSYTNIAVDSVGGVYIADIRNNVIRYVPASDNSPYTAGHIYTIAGGGVDPLSSGQKPTIAYLNAPTGLFVDTSKNIFITEGDGVGNPNNYIHMMTLLRESPSYVSYVEGLAKPNPYYKLKSYAMAEGASLVANSSLSSISSAPSVIPTNISFSGSINIIAADSDGPSAAPRCFETLGTITSTSYYLQTSRIFVSGGGTYKPGGKYITAGAQDSLVLAGGGVTLCLTDPGYVPQNIKIKFDTTLDLLCDLPAEKTIELIVIPI